jgi:trigger factor
VKATIVEEGACKRILSLEMPVDEVEPIRQKVIAEMKKIAMVPGFRPGRAPVGLLERRFKSAILQEIMEKALEEHLPGALEETKVQPLGKPELVKWDYDFGQPLTISLGFEVMPPLELKEYKGLAVEYAPEPFDESAVDRELDRIVQTFSRFEDVTDRPVAKKDLVEVSLDAEIDGQDAPVHEDSLVMMVDENLPYSLAALPLEGLAVGGERELDLEFPEDYYDKRFAGKHARWKVTAKSARQRIVPELDDEFVKTLGEYQTVAQLRERVEHDLRHAHEHDNRRTLENRVIDALLAGYEFEVPQVLVNAAFEGEAGGAIRNLMARGYSEDDIRRMDWSKIREDQAAKMQQMVRQYIILDKIAEKEGIAVTDEDVEREIVHMAEHDGRPVEDIKKALVRDGKAMDRIKSDLKVQKTVKFLIDAARVGTSPAEPPPAEPPKETPAAKEKSPTKRGKSTSKK